MTDESDSFEYLLHRDLHTVCYKKGYGVKDDVLEKFCNHAELLADQVLKEPLKRT